MSVSAEHTALQNLLSSNAQWAIDVEIADPGFFHTSAQGQAPKILWIGCSDSRVPESVITASRPGDIFVHRNIANQFHPDDTSALAVLAYAAEHVGVEHVIVVGHSNCGGAGACFKASCSDHPDHLVIGSEDKSSPLNTWLGPLTALATSLRLSTTPTVDAIAILAEENVKVQVQNVCGTATMQKIWAQTGNKGKVYVHGWIYDLELGEIRDLGITVGPESQKAVAATA